MKLFLNKTIQKGYYRTVFYYSNVKFLSSFKKHKLLMLNILLLTKLILAANQGRIFLWDENKMPCKRTYSASSGYSDPPDFRPFIEYYPAIGKIKGAVMICPGGAFQFRSMYPEGYSVADKLSRLGYQCFVVSYRLRPYTQQEGALDLQRAVRYVRKNAETYGINPENIAVVGFSAGGILCGELCLNWKDLTNAQKLESKYVPDELDNVNSTVAAIGHIYSFYGRLSVSNNNVDTLRNAKIPPSYYAYGTRDPFYRQFIQNAEASRNAGALVEEHVFEGQPHGFGSGNSNSNWTPLFDTFLTSIFASNDQVSSTATSNPTPITTKTSTPTANPASTATSTRTSTSESSTHITQTLTASNSAIWLDPTVNIDQDDANLNLPENKNKKKKSTLSIIIGFVGGVVVISATVAITLYLKKKSGSPKKQSVEIENDLLNGSIIDNQNNSII